MLSKSEVEALGSFHSERFLATTLILPLDVGQPPQYPVLLADMAREAEAALERHHPPRDALLAAKADLRSLARYVNFDLERAGARGLALFCCSGEEYWRAYPLPLPLPGRLRQEAAFYVRPLAALLDEWPPVMLALVGRRRARILRIQLGEVHEIALTDDVPARVREGGWQGYAERSIRGHIEDHVHRHFERVAARLLDIFRDDGFEWLVVGGQEAALPGCIAALHPYLRERLRGTVRLDIDAPDSEAVAAGREAERRIKAERDRELIGRVREGLSPGGWAVAGLNETLQLVPTGQVRTLLVRPGFSRQGCWCPGCRLLLPETGECPAGCGQCVQVADVVDEAVALALEQGAEVVHIAGEAEGAAMEGLGNVAAILRYT